MGCVKSGRNQNYCVVSNGEADAIGDVVTTHFVSQPEFPSYLPLDEAVASRAVFVIVSGSDGRTGGRAETLLEPAK